MITFDQRNKPIDKANIAAIRLLLSLGKHVFVKNVVVQNESLDWGIPDDSWRQTYFDEVAGTYRLKPTDPPSATILTHRYFTDGSERITESELNRPEYPDNRMSPCTSKMRDGHRLTWLCRIFNHWFRSEPLTKYVPFSKAWPETCLICGARRWVELVWPLPPGAKVGEPIKRGNRGGMRIS